MIAEILYGLAILFAPVVALNYIFDDLRKALLVYFFFIVAVFVTQYKLFEALPSSIVYMVFLFLTIVYALFRFVKARGKYDRGFILKMFEPPWNWIGDFLVIFLLSFVSLYIPIIQNWDFYTFYLQALYNPSFKSVQPLFSNIMLMHLAVVKDLGIMPRALSVFYIFIFYLLLVRLIGRYPSLLIIFLPSMLTVILHENLYLELPSLTILAMVYSYAKEDLSSSSLVLASVLLLFTKANFIVLALVILAYLFIYYVYRRFYRLLLILVIASLPVLLFYVSNAYVYDAYNFEFIQIYNDLAMGLGNSTLSRFWQQTVSGSYRVIPIYVSMLDVLVNLASPVYSLYILPLLIYLIANFKRVNFTPFQKFLAVISLFTWFVYSFGRSYIDINVYQNIFVIRYYVPLIFTFYILLISLTSNKETSQEVFKILSAVSFSFYTYLFATQGYFMKERVLLSYNNFGPLALTHIILLTIPLILFLIVYQNKSKGYLSSETIDIVYQSSMLALIIVVMLPIAMLYLSTNNISLNVDSTEYNSVLASALPQYYSSYYVSYSENDRIFHEIRDKCPMIYSFGGIYSLNTYSSAKIFLRAGHFSFLPFMLADLNLTNPSQYQNLVSRYPYLKGFELPSSFCLQVPTENHPEKSVWIGIKVLEQNSPSFSRIMNKLVNDKPIMETEYYRVYYIKIGG